MHDPTSVLPSGDVGPLLQRAVEEAARLLHADGGMVYLVDEATGDLQFAHDAGISGARKRTSIRGLRLPAGAGMFGKAFVDRRVQLTGDYPGDDRFPHTPAADMVVAEVGIRSMVVAPLLDGDTALGALGAFASRPDAFGDADVALVRALAEHAAAAMANRRLIDRLARSEAELARKAEELDASREEVARRAEVERSLREIGARISALRDVGEVIGGAVEAAVRLLGGDGGRVDVVEPRSGLLRGIYSAGERAPSDEIWPDTPDEGPEDGISGQTVARDAVVRTGDYLADDSFPHTAGTDHYVRTTGIRSVIAAPLRGESGPFGALTVFANRPDAFDDADGGVLSAIAEQAAVALTNARLIDELATSREELMRRASAEHALREIAGALTAIREPEAVLQRVVDETGRLVRADGTILSILEEDSGELRWAYDDGLRRLFDPAYVATLTLPLGVGPTGIAVAEARAIRVDRDLMAQFPDGAENDTFFATTGFRSMVTVPIVADAGPLGALEVYSRREAGFGDADEALLGALASQAAVALTNARLIEELGRSREENARRADAERSLREIAARVTAIREPDEILGRVVRAARRLLGANGAVIDLVDVASGVFRRAGDDGLDEATREQWTTLRVGEAVVRDVVRNRTVARIDDYLDHLAEAGARNEPGARDEAAFVERTGVRSFAVAPLVTESRVLGTLGVFSDRIGRWTSDDADLLAALADQAAIAVTNARLIRELEGSRAELARRVESERALREIAARVTALREPDEVLTQVVEEACRLLASDGGHLTLLEEAAPFLDPVVVSGGLDAETEAWFRSRRFPVGTGINGLAAGENRVISTFDYPLDPRINEEAAQGFAARLGIRAMAAAPLRQPGIGVIGTLAISWSEPRELAPAEAALLQGLADHAAIAVANSRLLERLASSEERYRHLVTASPDLTWEVDADGRFTFISDRILELSGYRPDEVIGQHFETLLHESTRDEAYARYADLVAEPGRVHAARFSLRHRDGRPVPIENFSIGVLRDGRFAGAHGAARDVSERDRLESGLRRQAAELAANEERAHLARELHDSVTQALFSMTLITRSIELLMARDPDAARDKLASLRDLQRDALAEMRSLIFELRPGSLEQDGLVHALRTHAAAVEGRIGLPILLDTGPLERLPIETEDALYRIAQEALHNIVKHASARQVRIALGRTDDGVRLRIEDDGRGFDPAAIATGHLGVAGMRSRAERIGALLVVDSTPGAGTRIDVLAPAAPVLDAPEPASAAS